MSHQLSRGGRITIVLASVFGLALPVAPAQASHFEDVQEVSALDGVGAAVAWSNLAFPDGAGAALLGRADLFADSLAAGSLQGQRPLLLTDSTKLSAATKDELDRLNVTSVTILGGTSAVAESVADELRTLGYSVNRLSGANRIETAVAVGRTRTGAARTALLARAFGTSDPTAAFADALSVGAWAADTGWPVLLTESERLSPQTAVFMRENVDQVYAVGGNAAISEAVLTEIRALGVAVRRVSGPSRFDTAVAVADARGFSSAGDASEVVLIDGQSADSWTDGFPAAAYAAGKNAPVVLGNSGSSTLPPVTKTFLAAGPGADLVTGWTVPSSQTDEAAEAMGKSVADTGVFQVRMTARNVVRASEDATTPIFGHGQPGTTGLLTLTADQEAKTLEYVFQGNAEGPYIPTFEKSSGLMLRKAAADQRGPASVVFPSPGSDGKSSGTVGESAFPEGFDLAELMSKPDAYYAEAYTQKFASGAIRGQLPNGGERHLPAQPDFVSITSGQNDDRVTLNFGSPVYAPVVGETGLKADHFTVTVADVHTAQVSSVDIATTARDARPTVHLKLNRTAVAGKTTTVALTAPGAGFIQNNLGEKPAGSTQSQITPSDGAGPVFQAIEAVGDGASVKLVFSEPVQIPAGMTVEATAATAEATRDIVIKSRSGGVEQTHVSAKNLTSSDTPSSTRTSVLSLPLTDAIPTGAEVTVTLRAAVRTGKELVDVAGNALAGSGDVVRSIAATATRTFRSVTVNDLAVGNGRLDPRRMQDQLLTAVAEGEIPVGTELFLLFPPGSTSGVWYDRAYGELTWAGGSAQFDTVSGTRASFGATTVRIPDGTVLTAAIHNIAVTAPSASSHPSTLRMGRSDGGAEPAPFSLVDPQLEITSNPVTRVGGTEHVIKVKFVTALASQSAISFDLSKLVAAGMSYGHANPTASGFTFSWAGEPKTRLIATNTGSNITVGSEVSFTIPVVGATTAVSNVPLGVYRGADHAARVTQLHHVANRGLAGFSVGTITTTATSTASNLAFTFTPAEALVKDDKVVFEFGTNLLTLANGGGLSVSGSKVTYTVPAAGQAAGSALTVTLPTVDARSSNNRVPISAYLEKKGSSIAERPRLSAVSSVSGTGVNEVPLHSVRKTGSGGNNWSTAGDTLTLTFVHPIIASNGSIVIKADANNVPGGTITCGTNTTCAITADRRVVTITLNADAGANTIVGIINRKVGSVSNFLPDRQGGTAGLVGVLDGWRDVVSTAPAGPPEMPPP